jgi:hypothetical protein
MRTASLSLLTILCLMLAVAPAMASYSNGPYNGTTDAWTINFGFTVSDSFTLSGGTVSSFHFVYWDASASDLLTTADLQLDTTSFGGSARTVAFSNTFLGTNQYGYNLYQADATGLFIPWSGGAGYVTLSNACSTSGCSVSNPLAQFLLKLSLWAGAVGIAVPRSLSPAASCCSVLASSASLAYCAGGCSEFRRRVS